MGNYGKKYRIYTYAFVHHSTLGGEREKKIEIDEENEEEKETKQKKKKKKNIEWADG